MMPASMNTSDGWRRGGEPTAVLAGQCEPAAIGQPVDHPAIRR